MFSKRFFLTFVPTEEPYYGSGSGSGAGIDDEDSDEGSGNHPIDYDSEVHRNNGPSTPVHSSTNPSSGVGFTNVVVKTEKENKVHVDHNETGNKNNADNADNSGNSGSSGSSAAASPTLSTDMSLRRALFTYFLPIYLAWFGGIVSDLL